MSRILLLLHDHSTLLELTKFLEPSHRVLLPRGDPFAQLFDLCILDSASLDPGVALRLRACKQAVQPQFLPVLFLTTPADLDRAASHYGQAIDDVIVTPIRRWELQARVDNLLKHRAVSSEFERLVSERVRSVSESELRLRTILEHEPDCVKLLAADGSLREMNLAGLRMIEASSFAEVENRSIYSLIAEEHRDSVRQFVERVFRGHEDQLEFEIIGLKGTRRWLELHAVPLRDPRTNEITALLGISRDITEQHQNTETLRASKDYLTRLLSATPVMIYTCKPYGNFAATFITENVAAQTGYAPHEFSANPSFWIDHVHPDDQARVLEAFGRLIDQGDLLIEYRFRIKDGTYRWMKDSAHLFRDAQGQPVEIAGCFLDVTVRKKAESDLREASQRLLNAEDNERRRIAKELHDSTSQDLVAASLILDGLLERRGAKPENLKTDIDDALALVLKSAHDIRTLAYILHPPRLDEAGLIGAIDQVANGFATRTGIVVGLELPEHLDGLSAEAEIILLRVVQESLANIHRHSHSSTAHIRLRQHSEGMILEIHDSGRGIAPLPPSPKKGSTPPGLGIAAMRDRLHQIGGQLHLESSPNGTTVRAILPNAKL